MSRAQGCTKWQSACSAGAKSWVPSLGLRKIYQW